MQSYNYFSYFYIKTGTIYMAAVGDIEGLSALFAIGVGVGAAVASAVPGFHGQSYAAAASLAGLVAMTCCFRVVPDGGKKWVLAVLFVLTGIFCALNDALPGITCGERVPELAGRLAERMRRVIDGISFGSEETGGIVKALLTGDRTGLSRETVAAFRESGAAHILALSGLHIGIIYMIFRRIFRLLGRSRIVMRAQFVLTLAMSGVFTLAVGAGPSIVRAFLYITIAEVVRLTGRMHEPVKVLSLALTVQLALWPGQVKEVGFQLSYAAMLGIALVFPVLRGWWEEGRVWSIASITLSCQMFTAPLSWYYFHSFPKYFLLTNLMAMPLTTVVMLLSVVTVVLSAMGICPEVLIRADDTVVQLLVRVLGIIATM